MQMCDMSSVSVMYNWDLSAMNIHFTVLNLVFKVERFEYKISNEPFSIQTVTLIRIIR